jgi:hypothetical protein
MPDRFDGCFYVTTVPNIEFSDGAFRVSYDISKRTRFEVAMPPSVFLQALKVANRASDQFHEGKAAVVPMRSP